MPIYPLPQFEADLALDRTEREAYDRLNTPKTVVVRFGFMKMIGEFPFTLNVKPGCGTKMVARTHRGTELAEMLTSTCPNAGCSKSVTRKEMLEYIENSGGKDYPYFNDGAILRIATADDLNEQRRIDGLRPAMKRFAQQAADSLGLQMRVVDAEPILGAERLTFYYTSEDRVDFRELVQTLSRMYPARIEMRQVGARDEARLIADYEKCGQHCCCKQFLKVLKPISMKAAKIQKATLDPLKISGRCGRLMCCLRYEDETYDTLRKRLPKMKSRVTTPDGPGTVVDAQILTQLVLVELDADGRRVAVPVESLGKDAPPAPVRPVVPPGSVRDDPHASRGPRPPSPSPRRPMPEPRPPVGDHPREPQAHENTREDPLRGMSAEEVERRTGGRPDSSGDASVQRGAPGPRQQSFRERGREGEHPPRAPGGQNPPRRDAGPRPPRPPRDRAGPRPQGEPGAEEVRREGEPGQPPPQRRGGGQRRRRRRRGGPGGPGGRGGTPGGPGSGPADSP